MSKKIGILTSGGDTPGLNAAIRAIGKTAIGKFNMQVIGFYDGFRGLMENRSVVLNSKSLSGILTLGGTILGTSRDKPHKMPVDGKIMDMTDVMVENYRSHKLDALICLGGGGTMKNAYQLMKKGLNIITLPKTIDNDVVMTDLTFGFDTALGIAVDAIDRLHSTAHSHHRIIVVEIMGNRAGWLALGSGIAGGADVILIPEIPYDIDMVAQSILQRASNGSPFSIVAVAEGALSINTHNKLTSVINKLNKADNKEDRHKYKAKIRRIKTDNKKTTVEIAKQLESKTQLEARVTILGHLQRGGTPSAADRLLTTRLGTACAEYINEDRFGIMIATKGEDIVPIPLDEVAGKTKLVPLNHSWIKSARNVGTCLGDF